MGRTALASHIFMICKWGNRSSFRMTQFSLFFFLDHWGEGWLVSECRPSLSEVSLSRDSLCWRWEESLAHFVLFPVENWLTCPFGQWVISSLPTSKVSFLAQPSSQASEDCGVGRALLARAPRLFRDRSSRPECACAPTEAACWIQDSLFLPSCFK